MIIVEEHPGDGGLITGGLELDPLDRDARLALEAAVGGRRVPRRVEVLGHAADAERALQTSLGAYVHTLRPDVGHIIRASTRYSLPAALSRAVS